MRNVIALLVLAGLAFIQPAMAQSYPTKPIRLIVPFPPGGSADATARPIAEKLSAALGQNIVVENRGGALTVLGAELAAKAAPDGYTLFLMPGAHVLSPRLVRNVPFHPVNDFTPIAMLAYVPFAIFTDPKQPFSTLQDMIAYAKANPGKLSIGITDAVGRLCIESLKSMAKIDVTLINYKGAPALATDVAGSQIHGGVITPPSILGFYKDRRLNVLAITGPKRLALMPNVPSVAEAAGLPDYSIQTWFALSGPSAMPRAVVDRLQREIQKIIVMPDIRERLGFQGMEPASDTSTATATATIKSEMNRLGKLADVAGIKPE